VGLLGAGATGANPTANSATWGSGAWSYSTGNAIAYVASQGGKAGSGGNDPFPVANGAAVNYPFYVSGGSNGGGGGGAYSGNGPQGGAGGNGAVRIIWPGTTRQFPSTNTGNL
jgi:hypothetical protein